MSTVTQDSWMKPDVVVIGGGVVGICTATYLAEAGRRVLLVDRTGVCEETSSGNAASLAFTDMMPLAQKGMLREVPRWLLDPLGPLSIRPAYLPKLLPWLLRFARAAHSPGIARCSIDGQASLMKLAEREWLALARRAGVEAMIRHDGGLEVYESEAQFRASLPGWAERDRHGVEYRHLNRAELGDLQPGLSPHFHSGTFLPGWKTVDDPQLFSKAVWAYAQSLGAQFRRATVRAITVAERGVRVTFDGGQPIEAELAVIAAGAWSHLLARLLGDRIPLETERGYNTTLPADAFDLKRFIYFHGHGFVAAQLSTGLRIGGAVEFGGLDLPPNHARTEAMLKKAVRFLPGLKTEGGRQWMGYRPSLPDSLPAIGRSTASPRILYAFGHGHLGLTQAAASGRLIRDLAIGNAVDLDLAPFRPQRFM